MTIDFEDHVTLYPSLDSAISAGVKGLKGHSEYMFKVVIDKVSEIVGREEYELFWIGRLRNIDIPSLFNVTLS